MYSIVSGGVLGRCSRGFTVYSSMSIVTSGVGRLLRARRRRRGSDRRRALDRHRGRVVAYIIGNVAGGTVTSGLCLSVRAIVARHHGVTHGLRVRSPTKLAVCTVIGGLMRLDSVGSSLWSSSNGHFPAHYNL